MSRTVLFVAGLLLGLTGVAAAQTNPFYRHNLRDFPPGQIGAEQTLRSPEVPGYFQPIEIFGPEGVQIAPAVGGTFEPAAEGPLTAALQVGPVYRFKVTGIPLQPGREVYPTVELVSRLHPPAGQYWKFPVPIELTGQELNLALAGRLVTRVIYVENPDRATPAVQRKEFGQPVFEAGVSEDPLRVADDFGRPIAILRMGSRLPPVDGDLTRFCYGFPPVAPAPPVAEATPEAPLGPLPDGMRSRSLSAPPRQPAIHRPPLNFPGVLP